MKKQFKDIDAFATENWYNEFGHYHRDNGLPAREYADGHKIWYLDGVCCRFDEWIEYFL